MSAYTKQAIKNSFLKLLNERPLSRVTVKAIVEDCGINRNTFYYHFADIPSLATEIITERADNIVREYANPESPAACLHAAVQFMTENRRAVMHMYCSISHDTVAFYLMRDLPPHSRGLRGGRLRRSADQQRGSGYPDPFLAVRVLRADRRVAVERYAL